MAIANGDPALLCTVGRKRVSVALADPSGMLDLDTLRSFDATTTTGVSDALARFQRDRAMATLPRRAAIAVAGLARGDVISVTRTRWFVSRPGIRAMLGEPPLILNDFAAGAWAMDSADVRPAEMFTGPADFSVRRPGCYVILGITSGLGTAVLTRAENGLVTVSATEAGHGAFAALTPELATLAAEMFPGRHAIAAEEVVSSAGLLAIHRAVAARTGAPARARTPEEVTRECVRDPVARQACELLCKAFWAQAANLVVTYGAWDGVIVTGAVAQALRPVLRRPDIQQAFALPGKHQRVLSTVPRGFATLQHAELIGLAAALRQQGAGSAWL